MTNECDYVEEENARSCILMSYHRMEECARQKMFTQCLNDQLFCVAYDALSSVETESGLPAEEVWCEALGVMSRIGKSPRLDLAFRHENKALQKRYKAFVEGGGHCVLRGNEAAVHTRCTVLTLLLYMFASASEEADSNPYFDMCKEIIGEFSECPIFQKIASGIKEAESKEESKGRFVPIQDYAQLACSEIKPEEPRLLEVNELLLIVKRMNSRKCYEGAIEVFSRYNDLHGKCIQKAVDQLREELDSLNRALSEPRLTEQIVVEKGGTHISQSSFKDTNFGFTSQSLLPGGAREGDPNN